MKPIKPKKMPKRLDALLRTCATHPVTHDLGLPQSDVRSILAALEYERQRADEAEKRASAAALEVDKCRSELSIYKPQHWHD